MPRKLVVKSARAGRMVKGRFVPNPKSKRKGWFQDAAGVFHQIRAAVAPKKKRSKKKNAKKKKAKNTRKSRTNKRARKAVQARRKGKGGKR